MEQTLEIRIRRVTRDKYDLVLLRDGEVSVSHGLSQFAVVDLLRLHITKVVDEISVGGSINFRSTMKFM
jgi:hypothetical protein